MILRGVEVSGIIKQGESIISLTLTILQIIGILVAIILIPPIIVQYILDLRPRHFMFEGFSNIEETLTDPQKSFLNLNVLAQEKLLFQCAVLYCVLLDYPVNNQEKSNFSLGATNLLCHYQAKMLN